MDRFYWFDDKTDVNERIIKVQKDVRLYDGDEKTTFDAGTLKLTNLRIIWYDEQQQTRIIALDLKLMKKIDFESSGLFKSAKISIHLHSVSKESKKSGPKQSSSFSLVKLSFRVGGQEEFGKVLQSTLSAKEWEIIEAAQKEAEKAKAPQVSHKHVGIGGIERKMQEKYKQTDNSISQAFKDLDALIDKAKDMVTLAEKFSSKLKDKQITDDETVQFKSYLLSMGIDNPVTREQHGTGIKYHQELAKQLASFLKNIIEDEGGVMTLTDVYCRFNRARGMELVSPDDVLNSAKLFTSLQIPMRLRKFDSGVLVIQALTQSEEQIIEDTIKKVEEAGCLTAEELGRLIGLPIVLAKERCLMSEKIGKLCRDDSVEGLRFYPNKFLLT